MPNVISEWQASCFRRDGFLFPVPALSESQTAAFRRQFEELARELGPERWNVRWMANVHLHFGWAYDLTTLPCVLDAVEDLLGPDIEVLSSILFLKPPGGPAFVSWHQDGRHLVRGAAPPRALTAWIALVGSNPENGCLRAIPGSHRAGYLPHECTRRPDNMLRRGETLVATIDESAAVHMALNAGQMSLHHIDAFHASGPNRSDALRIGFAVRYIHPQEAIRGSHAAVVLARGEDRYHNHEVLQRRPPDQMSLGIASLADARRAERELLTS